MSKAIFPNTFLIGVQKAGTTTLDDWLSQHPQIYCYDSLKDVHLFYRFSSREEMLKRMALETPAYNNELVVLQSAVNYIFYPDFMRSIAEYESKAKLILILRNPVDRAISSYHYFTKMHREKRSMEEALLYKPVDNIAFSKDNSDFTYIEHGWYFKQINECLKYFKREQLLVLDYDDLAKNPHALLKRLYSFLNVDSTFVPNLAPKNVTGSVKSEFIQSKMLKHNSFRKWIVDHLIDPWFPVNKRKMLKRKIFEWNTSKSNKKNPVSVNPNSAVTEDIKQQLQKHFIEDTRRLDELLHTTFSQKWFAKETITVA